MYTPVPFGLCLCGSLAVFILFASSDKGTYTDNKLNIWSCHISLFWPQKHERSSSIEIVQVTKSF